MSRAWNVDDCKYIFGTYTTVYYTSTYRVSHEGLDIWFIKMETADFDNRWFREPTKMNQLNNETINTDVLSSIVVLCHMYTT